MKTNISRHRPLLVAYSILFVMYKGFAIFVQIAIESSRDIFNSFGADLPKYTLFIINHGNLWFVLPAVILAPSLALTFMPNQTKNLQRKLTVFVAVMFVPLILFFVLFAVAMCIPLTHVT